MKIFLLIGCLFFGGIFLTGCGAETEEIIWENIQTESEKDTLVEVDTEYNETENQICIDICGAVMTPGVYFFEEGARVHQAVNEAGGFREDADRDSVNLAAFLNDGEKIKIYTVEEAAKRQQMQSEAGLVNLNTADIGQLCTLTGIGESRAEDIIAYREMHGSFKNIEEIMNVSGIKETTFQKIRDKIVVE